MMALGCPLQIEECMQSLCAAVLTLHPSAEIHLRRKRLLLRSTPHGVRQGALHECHWEFEVLNCLALPLIKAWCQENASKKVEYLLWQRHVKPKLPTSITSRVSLLSHHLLVRCVDEYFQINNFNSVFRYFAPVFHKVVSCASPFHLFSAGFSPSLPPSLPPLAYHCAGLFLRRERSRGYSI